MELVQKIFIDRVKKGDAELPQKKRISDDGVIEKVIEEIIHTYKIESQH